MATGTAKIPTSQRKTDRGNIAPKVKQSDILYMEVAAEGSEQDNLKYSPPLTATLSKGNYYSFNAYQVLILNTYCAKNDFIC